MRQQILGGDDSGLEEEIAALQRQGFYVQINDVLRVSIYAIDVLASLSNGAHIVGQLPVVHSPHVVDSEETIRQLSVRKKLILKAVFELGAKDSKTTVTGKKISSQVKLENDADFRNELSMLRSLGLLGGQKGERGYSLAPQVWRFFSNNE